MLTQEYLKQILRYEPETGHWFWKGDKAYNVTKGSRAGHL